MSFIDGILDALGIGGGSLQHIQAMARSVRPEEIEAMAAVFDHGTQVFNTGHGHLESAIDNVVTGWKGDAARAASTTVLNGAMTSRSSAESSSTAASNVRSYASQVSESKQQILAIQPVDTSFGHAVQASGGPVMAALNPGAVATNMMAAQIKSEQQREQAANYLSQMNTQGEQFAGQQSAVFTPVPPPKGRIDSLPATFSVHAPSASGGGGPMPGVQAPSGGSGPSAWSPPPTSGGPGFVTPVHQPNGGPGTSGPGSTGNGNPGNGNPGNGGGPVTVPPPPGSTTVIQGANPPATSVPAGPPVALPDPATGGSGLGAGTAALLGGGAAAVAAGGLAGLSRSGGFPGGRALAGGGSLADGPESGLGGRGAGGALEERGFGRGGFGGAAEETPGRFGVGSGAGAMDAAEESALRAGRMSAAAAGELAAGERGMMPPMGAGAGRGNADEELEKRPDYLVETDDVWGDGRLAAPPVLG